MLYFYNDGEIDINGATIAGLSAKDNNKPIGFFGTGLKYAIACILRWDGEISIWSGKTKYIFSLNELMFRGASFKQIVMTNRSTGKVSELGFTTEYGKNWKPWQVFRELYSNAIDENGDVTQYDSKDLHGGGKTVIEVSSEELHDIYPKRDSIILPKTFGPKIETKYGYIYNTPNNSVYYRGVRVAEAESKYTYNITDTLDLTEDRTVDTYYMRRAAGRLVINCKSRDIIYDIITAKDGLESDLYYTAYSEHTPEFMDACRQIHLETPNKYATVTEFLKRYDKTFKENTEVTISTIQKSMMDKAIRVCCAMFNINDSELPNIKYGNLGRETLGLYDPKCREIWIDVKCFNSGTKFVTSTLYEEITHWLTGHTDCNYTMQTYLFDKIITLYEEHVLKEPI